MIYIFTDSKDIRRCFENVLKSKEIYNFGYIFDYSKAYDFIQSKEITCYKSPEIIILDAMESRKKAAFFCKEFQKMFNNVAIGTIIKKNPNESSLYRYVENSDFEMYSPVTENSCKDFLLSVLRKKRNSLPLKISENRNETFLMGYELKLSKCEHRILYLLFSHTDFEFSAEEISELCFFDSKSKNSIPVLVHKINEKAKNISGRKIIQNHKKFGYFINKFM